MIRLATRHTVVDFTLHRRPFCDSACALGAAEHIVERADFVFDGDAGEHGRFADARRSLAWN